MLETDSRGKPSMEYGWMILRVFFLAMHIQSVAKLVTHSAKFWNFLDERRTTAKKIPFAKFPPAPRINVDHSFHHYGHFVSGQHCAGGRGEGGKFYLGLGYSKIRHKRSSVSLILQPIVVLPLLGSKRMHHLFAQAARWFISSWRILQSWMLLRPVTDTVICE